MKLKLCPSIEQNMSLPLVSGARGVDGSGMHGLAAASKDAHVVKQLIIKVRPLRYKEMPKQGSFAAVLQTHPMAVVLFDFSRPLVPPSSWARRRRRRPAARTPLGEANFVADIAHIRVPVPMHV